MKYKNDELSPHFPADLDKLNSGKYRKICNKRARKLRKRGEFVKWAVDVDSYVWEPKNRGKQLAQ